MMKMFKSRKNKVYLQDSIVVKEHHIKEHYEREKYFYKTFAKDGILFYDDEHMTLHMPFLEGPTLLEALEQSEVNEDIFTFQQALLSCLDKLEAFHENYGYSMKFSDVNFRNFILGVEVHLIDFEDAKEGNYKEDYYDFCGMLLMYEPSFSEFKQFMMSWIKPEICKRLSIEESTFDINLDDALNRIRNRRLKYG